MGNTWVVSVWLPHGKRHAYDEFQEVYVGESWIAALWAAIKARRRSCYVKIDWR